MQYNQSSETDRSCYLNGPLPYVRRHITVNKMLNASLNKTFHSFLHWKRLSLILENKGEIITTTIIIVVVVIVVVMVVVVAVVVVVIVVVVVVYVVVVVVL